MKTKSLQIKRETLKSLRLRTHLRTGGFGDATNGPECGQSLVNKAVSGCLPGDSTGAGAGHNKA